MQHYILAPLVIILAIPGVILVPAALLLRRLAPKIPPNLPLRTPMGEILYTRKHWIRDLFRAHPVQWLALMVSLFVREVQVRFRAAAMGIKAWVYRSHGDLMLEEAFARLCTFVAKNRKILRRPEPADPVDAELWSAQQELLALWNWWRGPRKSDRAACLRAMAQEDDVSKRLKYWVKLQEYEQHQLVRLVNVRTVM